MGRFTCNSEHSKYDCALLAGMLLNAALSKKKAFVYEEKLTPNDLSVNEWVAKKINMSVLLKLESKHEQGIVVTVSFGSTVQEIVTLDHMGLKYNVEGLPYSIFPSLKKLLAKSAERVQNLL